MTTKKKKIIEKNEFDRILKRLAIQIVEKNIKDIKDIAIVGIRKRGVPLAKRIASFIKKLEGFEIPIGELDISLYRDDQTVIAYEPLVYGQEINFSFENKILIIVDDVLQTGKTARAAMEAVLDKGKPEAIRLCVFVDTRSRTLPVSADFTGIRLSVSKNEYIKLSVKETDGADSIEIIKKEVE
ncbi:MAG: bifunctional pyr operon transcriptional regulator/uracil phosphoribosyltransferase PyrR [Candidatus Muiribacteriota bacterium]